MSHRRVTPRRCSAYPRSNYRPFSPYNIEKTISAVPVQHPVMKTDSENFQYHQHGYKYRIERSCCDKKNYFIVSITTRISCFAMITELADDKNGEGCICAEKSVRVVLTNLSPGLEKLKFQAHLLEKYPEIMPSTFSQNQHVEELPIITTTNTTTNKTTTTIINNNNSTAAITTTAEQLMVEENMFTKVPSNFKFILCAGKLLKSQMNEVFRSPHLRSKNDRVWNNRIKLYYDFLLAFRTSMPNYSCYWPTDRSPLRNYAILQRYRYSGAICQKDIDKCCQYNPLDYLITEEEYIFITNDDDNNGDSSNHNNNNNHLRKDTAVTTRRRRVGQCRKGDVFTTYTLLRSSLPLSLQTSCMRALNAYLDELQEEQRQQQTNDSFGARNDYIAKALYVTQRIKRTLRKNDLICKHTEISDTV